MPKHIETKGSSDSLGSKGSQDSTDKAAQSVKDNRGSLVANNMAEIARGMQERNNSKARMQAIEKTEQARIKKIEGYYAQEKKDAAWRSAQKPAQPVVAKPKKGRPESTKQKVGGREALDEIIKREKENRAAEAAKIAAADPKDKSEPKNKKSWRPW